MDQDARSFVTATYEESAQGLDSSLAPLVEVTILWGEQVLDVQHLNAPHSFVLESEQPVNKRSSRGHFVLPPETLREGNVRLVVDTPRGPVLALHELPGEAPIRLAEHSAMTASELAAHARALGGTHEGNPVWPLGVDPIEVRLGDVHLSLCLTSGTKPVPRALFTSSNHNDLTYFGLSFLSAAGVLASAAFFTPPLSLTAAEGLNRDDLILMQQYLDAAAEREQEQKVDVGQANESASGGEPGERAHHNEGAMGDTSSVARNKRYQVKGPTDNPDPHLARARALEEAVSWGAIELLTALTGDPNSPTAPWGREAVLGRDSQSANGNMWADDIGAAFGSGGLALTSMGDGGGGLRDGIGVGSIGTFNRGMGGTGDGGFGRGHGRLPGSHRVKGPVMRVPSVTVSGRLPPQVIQRVVRQNHGRFRLCYERGLSSNPSLEGRVNVRFVIGRNGAVTNVSNGGSSLPAADVVNCVVKAFYGLSFPTPEGGLVTVSYPLAFSPG